MSSATSGPDVTRLVETLVRAGETVATAESLTGGLVVAALTGVPGASATVRGGICAYQADVKADLLGVDARLLEGGAVQPDVAAQLAAGSRDRLGATWGIGTTGVAGPEPADGRPVGTVYVAVAGPGGVTVEELALDGGRERIRSQTVRAALALLARRRAAGRTVVADAEQVP